MFDWFFKRAEKEESLLEIITSTTQQLQLYEFAKEKARPAARKQVPAARRARPAWKALRRDTRSQPPIRRAYAPHRAFSW